MLIFENFQSIIDAISGIKYFFPRNWIFITLILFFSVLILYLNKDKIFNINSNIKNYLKIHSDKLTKLSIIAILVVIVLAVPNNVNLFSSKPQEDTFLVAIAPFYSEVDGKKVSDNYKIPNELKTKIESYNNLGIDVIILDYSKNAEFQGKNKGAYLVVYGKRIEDTEGYVEIEYNILALTDLYVIPSDIQSNVEQTNEINGLMFTENATYYKYVKPPIKVREPLNENASSIIFLIGAFEQYKKSNFTSAIPLFKSYKNFDNSPLILFYIANSYYFNNDLNKSLQYLDKTIDIIPQFSDAWNNKGLIFSRLGRYEEALAAYDNTTRINQQDAGAWHDKGFILGKLGRYEDALAASDNAIRINPQDAGAWYNKGLSLFKLGRYEEALVAYNNATRINPQDADAWYNKGLILSRLGRHEEALAASDNATRINPQNVGAWDNKALMLFELGRYGEALAASDNATRINQRDAGAWNNKALMLFKLERYEEALAASDNVTRINPQDADAWNNKGLILFKLERYEEALAASDNVTRINPQDAKAWHNKALILDKLGRYEEALAAADNATRINQQLSVPSLQ